MRQKDLRIENERYLRDHPEVKELVNKFLIKVLDQEPDDIKTAAAEYFTDPKSYDFLNE
jgi:hypothetical protein